jgi:predicted dehydrogenase
MDPIRIGIVSGGASAEAWLRAVDARDDATVAVVFDRDAERGARWADRYAAVFEDDQRAVFIHHDIQAVIVATSPAGAVKPLLLAAEHGAAAAVDAPSVRTVEDAATVIAAFESAERPILVASGWRFDPVMDVCRAPGRLPDRVALADGRLITPVPAPLDWRGDAVRAGGVLVCSAYDMLDQMVSIMGIPGSVYAAMQRVGRASDAPYDGEDSAVITLRYAGGVTASLTARWGAPPWANELRVENTRQSLIITETETIAHGTPDEMAGRDAVDVANPSHGTRRAARCRFDVVTERLANACRMESDTPPPAAASSTSGTSMLRDHLATLAVAETAYLSHRTGEAESPHQVFERAGVALPMRRGDGSLRD